MPMTEQVAGHGGRVVESVAWPHRCVPFWHTRALYSGHRAVSGRTGRKKAPITEGGFVSASFRPAVYFDNESTFLQGRRHFATAGNCRVITL